MASINPEDIQAALAKVEDPEIHRPITDLGMVKSVDIDGGVVKVAIFLTVSGCPMKDTITQRITIAVGSVRGVSEVQVELDVMNDELRELQQSPGGIFTNKNKKIEQLKQDRSVERANVSRMLSEIDIELREQYTMFMDKVDMFNKAVVLDKTPEQLKPLYDMVKANEQQIADYKLQVSDTDIGSFRFIARSFDIDADVAVKWFIIMIVIVFDPMAVCLIIGYNVMLTNRETAETPGVFTKLHEYMKSKSLPGVHVQKTDSDMMRPRHRPDN